MLPTQIAMDVYEDRQTFRSLRLTLWDIFLNQYIDDVSLFREIYMVESSDMFLAIDDAVDTLVKDPTNATDVSILDRNIKIPLTRTHITELFKWATGRSLFPYSPS